MIKPFHRSWLLAAALPLLGGCAALDKALENRMACSLDRTELYFVSKYGPVGISAEVAQADARVACAAVSAAGTSAAPAASQAAGR